MRSRPRPTTLALVTTAVVAAATALTPTASADTTGAVVTVAGTIAWPNGISSSAVKAAPPGFLYAVKFSRFGTHMKKLLDPEGTIGLFLERALAGLDIALWDIRGKVFSQPVSRLLGGHRERVPTYASGALMRGSLLRASPAHGRRRDKRA